MITGTHIYTWFKGVLVGTDESGNRYYRERNPPAHRREKRWVMFKGKHESTRVPAEWHAWLHHTSEQPLAVDPNKGFIKPVAANATGSAGAYLPPGHDWQGGNREKASGDYQPWQPA